MVAHQRENIVVLGDHRWGIWHLARDAMTTLSQSREKLVSSLHPHHRARMDDSIGICCYCVMCPTFHIKNHPFLVSIIFAIHPLYWRIYADLKVIHQTFLPLNGDYLLSHFFQVQLSSLYRGFFVVLLLRPSKTKLSKKW